MTREEWQQLCFNIAREHPEYLRDTFEAFSAGVYAQAEDNRDKVAKMGAALCMLYEYPNPKTKHGRHSRKLARDRMIESRLFQGTPFEEQLRKDK